MRNYFTLFRYDHDHKMWCVEFGDYDRTTVNMERRDIHTDEGVSFKDLRVIKHRDEPDALASARLAMALTGAP